MPSPSKTSFLGVACIKAKPTQGHRPAVWETMLGAVDAMNPDGEVRHFGYDYAAAIAFAEVAADGEPRLARVPKDRGYFGLDPYRSPRAGKLVVWVKR